MRFYAIKIDGAPDAFPAVPGSPVAGAQFSSVADGGHGMVNDPGALRCVMRLEMVNTAAVTTNSFLRLYGVDIKMLKQASNLNGLSIQIYAGFWPGLPLATEEAPYAGAVYCGKIHQAFGNWQDEDMTLDLLINPGNDTEGAGGGASGTEEAQPSKPLGQGGIGHQRLMARQQRVGYQRPTPGRRRHATQPLAGDGGGGDLGNIASDIGGALQTLASSFGAGMGWGSIPANLIHNWQPGELLSNAIRKTLTQAFPWCTIDIDIAGLLTNPAAHDSGFYSSLEQYMAFARQTSMSLMTGTKGAVGTLSSVIGGMAQLSGSPGLQSLSNALSSAGANSKDPDEYQGIHSFIRCQRIHVTDFTTPRAGPTLKFEELIGQPTWLKSKTITFKVPMRADIYPGIMVTLPPDTLEFVERNWQQVPGEVNTLAVNFANQGVNLTQVTAIGDSRHPDGGSWALTCVGIVANVAFTSDMFPDSSTPTGMPKPPASPPGSPGTAPSSLLRRPVRRYAV